MPNRGDRSGFSLVSAMVAATSVAVAAPAVAQDSGDAQAEDTMVYLEADRVVEDRSTGDYYASGNVTARYGTRVLQADEIVFRPSLGRVIAKGNITILDDNGLVTFAEEAEFDDDLGAAVIAGFGARLESGGTIGAQVATRNSTDDIQIVRGFYTACQACVRDDKPSRPTWRIRARKVTRETESRAIYYRDAVFEVKGIPVAYSPFFSHADPSVGRRSGFLLPNLGESSRTGNFYQQPYYWAISDYQDLTLSPRLMTEANPLIGFEYRRKFFSGNVTVQGSATFEEEFSLLSEEDLEDLTDAEIADIKAQDGEFRGNLFADGDFRINDNWTWGFGIERVTGDAFFIRYEVPDSDVRRGIYRRGGRRLLSQAYALRQTENSYASIATFDSQDLRTDEEDALPVAAPFAEVRRTFGTKFLGGRMEARANLAVLERKAGVDYRRFTVESEWARRIVTRGGVVISPFASARADAYQLSGEVLSTGAATIDPDETEVADQAGRVVGNMGVDASFPVGRRVGPLDVVVEPIVNVTVAPTGVNQGDLVNLDSQSIDLDEASMFSANRSTGFDLFEEGVHAAAGARASVDWTKGRSASLFLGQSYRTEPLDNFPASSGLDGRTSDVVGALAVQLNRRTSLDANVRLDDDGYEVQRLDAIARTGVGPLSVGVRYLQFDEELATASNRPTQEANVDLRVNVTNNWSAYYRFNRDLDEDETRREFVGLVYGDNCTRVEVVYKSENFAERVAGTGDSLTVRFTLSTLGAFEAR